MTPILLAILAFVAVGAAGWVFAGNGASDRAAKRAKEIASPKRKMAKTDALTAEKENQKRKAANRDWREEIDRKASKREARVECGAEHGGRDGKPGEES